MAEVCRLLRHNQDAVAGLFRGFADDLWAIAPLGPESLPPLEAFLKRYYKIGAQLADACLVYLAEREGIHSVFTLDQRGFSVDRYSRNRRLKIIPTPYSLTISVIPIQVEKEHDRSYPTTSVAIPPRHKRGRGCGALVCKFP
jgi:hypothetical protein